MCKDMCVDMCVDMCRDICIGMCKSVPLFTAAMDVWHWHVYTADISHKHVCSHACNSAHAYKCVTDAYVDIRICLCVDMCLSTCADMCVSTCVDMCVPTCVDMRAWT